MPRRRKRLTPEQVEQCERLSAVGCTYAQMAGYLGMTAPEFDNVLQNTTGARDKLNKAKIGATAAVANSLFTRAQDGDVNAQKFWLTSQGGEAWQSDKGGPNITVNLSAALADIGKIIDNQSDTGPAPAIVESINPAKGYIDQEVSADTGDAGAVVSGSDRYLVRDSLRVIDALAAAPPDPDEPA